MVTDALLLTCSLGALRTRREMIDISINQRISISCVIVLTSVLALVFVLHHSLELPFLL